jgi:hypothetical protein
VDLKQEDYMAQPALKPKKLWGNPKVFLSANELIVAEKSYVLAEIKGAYLDLAPEAEVQKDFGTIVWKVLRLLLEILSAIFAGTVSPSSKKYQLILVSDAGLLVAVEHQNAQKLMEIAIAVNQALKAMGITPQTKRA